MSRPSSRTSRKGTTKQNAPFLGCLALIPVALWVGDDLWALSRFWPAGDIGFGATVGVLLPIAVTNAKRAFRRARSAEGESESKGRGPSVGVGVACTAVAVMCGLAVARTIPGGRSSRRICSGEWAPCWVPEHYPAGTLTAIVSAVAMAVLVTWGRKWIQKSRTLLRRPAPKPARRG
ncbi:MULTISPECIES: hypothetical protein [unclassified Streptomyces]|uniref:hypothetical protein n=1 Tax=unclassified Streptomyces TaxID=2593676 RepID=UPI00278C625F|nr:MULTISPECIES: hypothetical protein [unclassified Streptomyces]